MESSSFLGRGDSTKTRKAVSLKTVWDLEIERNPFFGSQCNGIPGLLGMPVGTNCVVGYCERLWNGKKENQSTYSGIENPFYNISTFYSFELFHSFCKLYKINNNANDTCP